MKKKFKIIGIVTLICIFFLYGYLMGKYKIFPFKIVHNIYLTIFNNNTNQKISESYYGRWEQLRVSSETKSDKKEALKKISTLPYLKGYGTLQS